MAQTQKKRNPMLPGKPNPIHQWNDDEEFLKLYQKVAGNTLVDLTRCYILYQFAYQTRSLPAYCLSGVEFKVNSRY